MRPPGAAAACATSTCCASPASGWTVAELDPTDEEAHVELMRDHLADGDGDAALLRYGQLERAGGAGSASSQLRDHIQSGLGGPVRRRTTTVVRGSTAGPRPCVDDLVAELAELSRRQAELIGLLASAHPYEPLALGAAS